MITENTLRIKIEATGEGQLKASLDSAAQSVGTLDTAQQGNATATTTATAAQEANAAATAAVGVASESTAAKVAAATATNAESLAAQSARLKAMIAASREKLLADTGLAESERSLAERAGQRVELSAAEWAAIKASTAATRDKATADIEAMTAESALSKATTANTVQTEANTVAHKLNARTQYELGVLGGELASGNISRMKRSVAALGNATGVMAKVMTPTGLAITGVVGSLGLLAAAAVHSMKQEDELNRALLATGKYAEMTSQQLQGTASRIQGASATYGQSIDVLTKLVASGQVADDSLQSAGQAAIDMATLTGQSMDSAVSAVVRLGRDPVAAAAALNDEFHFLTASQNAQIISLQRSGDTADAARVAFDALGRVMHARAMQAKEDQPWFTTAFDKFKQGWSNIGAGIGQVLTLGGHKSEVDKYTAAVQRYRDAEAQLKRDQAAGVTGLPYSLHAASVKSAARDMTSIWNDPAFQKERNQKNIAGVVQSVQNDGVQAITTLSKLGITLDGLKDKQTKVNDAAAALYKAHLAGVNFPGVNFNGVTADTPQGKGWDAIVKKLNGSKSQRHQAADPFTSLNHLVQSAQVFDGGIGGTTAQASQVNQILALAAAGGKLISAGHDIAKVQADVAVGVTALNEGYAKQADILKQHNIEALKTYQGAIDQQIIDKQKQIDLQIASIGMGTKEVQQQQALAAIYTTVDKTIEQLNRARSQKGANIGYIDGEIAKQKASIPILVAQERAKFAAIDTAQSQWSRGATTAMTNYVDEAKNAAAQVGQAFTTLSSDMESSLVNWVSTGQLSFSTFERDFESMLEHMAAKALLAQAETSLLNIFFASYGAAGNNTSSSIGTDAAGGAINFISAVGGKADGGRVNGPGTGTSDSVPAWLSHGENVITAKATDYYGQTFMDNLNAMRLPRFAQGGPVGGGGGSGGGMGGAPQVIVHNNNHSDVKASAEQKPDGQWLVSLVLDTVSHDMARGGRTAKVMEGRYGLSRRGIAVGG